MSACNTEKNRKNFGQYDFSIANGEKQKLFNKNLFSKQVYIQKKDPRAP